MTRQEWERAMRAISGLLYYGLTLAFAAFLVGFVVWLIVDLAT